MNVCEAHPWCCFSLLLIHAEGSVLLQQRNLVKENRGVWRRRIYRKYASCRWLRTQDLNLHADVVLNMSRGPPGQWFPETEYWASAIFVGTSGIPPKIIYRTKNYRGITLTSIAAKIYNALLRNRIEPKIDNILRKNQNGFRRNRSTTSQILTIRRILEGVRAKNLQATLIFVDFTEAFDSIHRGKMEQILLAYGIPKETVAAITILYRNTNVKVRSPDGDTEYFDIVAGVLQGDTLAPYLFIICLDYVLRTSIDKIRENGFELTKKRSRRYPATTITDADYADDIAILANTPNQAETLLQSLEGAAAGIGLYVNAHKTEYMCYNQTGDISTLEGTPLKLVDKFTYLGSSVESTEKDIETRLTKAWTAINRLSIIWKSDLTDKMKRSFFQATVTSILL